MLLERDVRSSGKTACTVLLIFANAGIERCYDLTPERYCKYK
jgi:hypothetical protein